MTSVATLVTVLVTAALLGPRAAAAGEVTVGVARDTFVLPEKVPLAGYSRREGASSQGVHDPVGVRALVLQDEETTAALVSCDLLIIDERLFDAVRRRLIAEGLPERLVLLLAATHTHSGPGAYGTTFLEKLSMGHFNPAVFDALVGHIARTVIVAHAARAPAQTTVRSVATSGLLTNRMDPQGPVDGELTVCAWSRAGASQPFAVIVGFAAHPTTLGAWNRQLSADYPGVVTRHLERRFPGVICLFFAGAVGDQAPVKHAPPPNGLVGGHGSLPAAPGAAQAGGFEAAEWLGRALSEQAVALLAETADATPARRLHAMQERMPLPPAHLRLGRWTLPRWLGRRFVDDDATLSLVAVEEAVWVGVPCDLTASLGERLKEAARARGRHPMVVGFASDYIGYCLPAALYESGAYEARLAFNGPHTGELIVERLTQMLQEITGVVSDQ